MTSNLIETERKETFMIKKMIKNLIFTVESLGLDYSVV